MIYPQRTCFWTFTYFYFISTSLIVTRITKMCISAFIFYLFVDNLYIYILQTKPNCWRTTKSTFKFYVLISMLFTFIFKCYRTTISTYQILFIEDSPIIFYIILTTFQSTKIRSLAFMTFVIAKYG
jgi:hypothetical protein